MLSGAGNVGHPEYEDKRSPGDACLSPEPSAEGAQQYFIVAVLPGEKLFLQATGALKSN